MIGVKLNNPPRALCGLPSVSYGKSAPSYILMDRIYKMRDTLKGKAWAINGTPDVAGGEHLTLWKALGLRDQDQLLYLFGMKNVTGNTLTPEEQQFGSHWSKGCPRNKIRAFIRPNATPYGHVKGQHGVKVVWWELTCAPAKQVPLKYIQELKRKAEVIECEEQLSILSERPRTRARDEQTDELNGQKEELTAQLADQGSHAESKEVDETRSGLNWKTNIMCWASTAATQFVSTVRHQFNTANNVRGTAYMTYLKQIFSKLTPSELGQMVKLGVQSIFLTNKSHTLNTEVCSNLERQCTRDAELGALVSAMKIDYDKKGGENKPRVSGLSKNGLLNVVNADGRIARVEKYAPTLFKEMHDTMAGAKHLAEIERARGWIQRSKGGHIAGPFRWHYQGPCFSTEETVIQAICDHDYLFKKEAADMVERMVGTHLHHHPRISATICDSVVERSFLDHYAGMSRRRLNESCASGQGLGATQVHILENVIAEDYAASYPEQIKAHMNSERALGVTTDNFTPGAKNVGSLLRQSAKGEKGVNHKSAQGGEKSISKQSDGTWAKVRSSKYYFIASVRHACGRDGTRGWLHTVRLTPLHTAHCLLLTILPCSIIYPTSFFFSKCKGHDMAGDRIQNTDKARNSACVIEMKSVDAYLKKNRPKVDLFGNVTRGENDKESLASRIRKVDGGSEHHSVKKGAVTEAVQRSRKFYVEQEDPHLNTAFIVEPNFKASSAKRTDFIFKVLLRYFTMIGVWLSEFAMDLLLTGDTEYKINLGVTYVALNTGFIRNDLITQYLPCCCETPMVMHTSKGLMESLYADLAAAGVHYMPVMIQNYKHGIKRYKPVKSALDKVLAEHTVDLTCDDDASIPINPTVVTHHILGADGGPEEEPLDPVTVGGPEVVIQLVQKETSHTDEEETASMEDSMNAVVGSLSGLCSRQSGRSRKKPKRLVEQGF